MRLDTSAQEYRKGVGFALAAYFLWGIAPLYFRAIRQVGPLEIVCHRVIWSVVFLIALLIFTGELGATLQIVRTPRILMRLFISSALIATNWLLFIYCVVTARTLEASFGYFINPLISIALGVLLLGERLSRLQLACLAFAVIGVLLQLVALGHLPWLALTMAVTFGLYGLVRKQTPVGPLPGLTIETIVAMPAALFGLVWFAQHGQLAFTHRGLGLDAALVSAGLVTSIPLLLFAAGARRIPLSMVGFLQYLAPSLQFLMAVAVIGEPLSHAKLVSFAFVWLSLFLLLIGPRIAAKK